MHRPVRRERRGRDEDVLVRPARWALGLGGAAAAAGLGLGAWVGAAAYVARVLLTPGRDQTEDQTVVWVRHDVEPVPGRVGTIRLLATDETVVPGRYGLWFDRGRGHARVGDLLELDDVAGQVTRILEAVDVGDLRPGPARWNGYYHGLPPTPALGLASEEILLDSELGKMPAWIVPADGSLPVRRWAILVHGRGALRLECLRAVPVLHRLGLTCLVVAYRNDEDAPSSSDRRYALGIAEWADVEGAMSYALSAGAQELVLVGWSMGGAIVLQTLARSALSSRVSRVILDAPVVDWADVIAHHGALARVPALVTRLAPVVLRSARARHLVGISSPLDVAETNWTSRSDELVHPVLLIHSVDDEFVPVGPSRTLAEQRPDLVTWIPWTLARHTKEWNTDPDRWDAVVADFVGSTH